MKLDESDYLKASYDATKVMLYAKSYVGEKVIRSLRVAMKMPLSGFTGNLSSQRSKYVDWVHKYEPLTQRLEDCQFYTSDPVEKKKLALQQTQQHIIVPIHVLAQKAKLDPYFLEEVVLYNRLHGEMIDRAVARVIPYGGNPIIEPGIYIQVFPNTRLKDLEKTLDFSKEYFEKLYGLKPGHRDQKGEEDRRDIHVYLTVEKCIREWIQSQKDSRRDNEYSKKETVVSGAIALSLDELDPKITSNDKTWIENRYYRVISRYELPQVSELESSLGFITK